ncbi:MAG: biosynthetic arginine decarboxylase [Opitutales bacterium]
MTRSNSAVQPSRKAWSTKQAEELYGLRRWGAGHFSINKRGELCVHPLGNGRKISLLDIIEEAKEKGIKPPMTIRVQDLLRKRVEDINNAFGQAIREEEYAGSYRGVFPIKVNQLREVVDEILEAGEPFQFGLEAGSKAELMVALAMLESRTALLICNGYKDDDYIRLALMGRRLGKQVIIVVEQLSEVDRILRVAREMDIPPAIGVRLKLRAEGEGKWATSTGENAKFGLTAAEVVALGVKLRRANLTGSLQLVHFHIGSQVPNIITLKKAVVEAARFYGELVKMGFPMRYLDVGGGLGVDYDGSKTNYDSSMNYSLDEYARDVVANIKSVCEASGVPVPDIVSESGRAIVASHSILVIEAVDRVSRGPDHLKPSERKKTAKKKHPILADLESILEGGSNYTRLERFHDAQQKKEEAYSLFTLGYLDLATRAEAENLFWRICQQLQTEVPDRGYVPDELAELQELLADQYVCNFSVFQSLLDHWALDQLFPVVPLQRLNEEPTVQATLVDITCDSDGKISEFIDLQEEVKNTLSVHPLEPGKPYYFGVFLVGAYQDIMGDLHNLFGRVGEAHVFLEEDEEDDFYIEETLGAFQVDEVLPFVQHKGPDLVRLLKKQVDRATREDRVKPREGVRLLGMYEELLQRKTYLEADKPRPKGRKSAARKRTAS